MARNPNPYGGGNANPGGPGGYRGRIRTGGGPFGSAGRAPRVRPASNVGDSGTPPKKGCCSMVAAVRAVRRRKYRLARRYAVMSARLIAARIA